MFWPTINLINMGKEIRKMLVNEKKRYCATLSNDRKRLLLVLEKLLKEDPTLIDRLGKGQSNGRSEDMGKVTKKMAKWKAMAWDPPLGNKPTRGLFHIQCAKLLSPISYDWTDPEVCDDFLSMKLLATPLHFPCYLWLDDGDNYNPRRPLDGLLMNKILICAAFCVLFSPNLVKSISPSTNQVSGARGSTFKRSKGMIGLAKSYNLTWVTPAFIAYIAVVVRHSLTTDATFSEICGGFNYGIYYNKIREYLEAPQFAGRAKVLLDWWNMQLFGSYNMGANADNDDGAGTLDALYAEAEGDPSLTDEETEPQEDEDQLGDD
ncbi:hypothetical protein RHS04_07821 [Rhizoctonia solani]|uniref:Uncharacterized protein n=1 Tax=Rhizoctonia solani TaxID=456999 RepID=A0A8H7LH64_9AGAM|nr:hypothetical protein RHS04_07821 [Rhizoctonia solani]